MRGLFHGPDNGRAHTATPMVRMNLQRTEPDLSPARRKLKAQSRSDKLHFPTVPIVTQEQPFTIPLALFAHQNRLLLGTQICGTALGKRPDKVMARRHFRFRYC